jgi:hypothetical protein
MKYPLVHHGLHAQEEVFTNLRAYCCIRKAFQEEVHAHVQHAGPMMGYSLGLRLHAMTWVQGP